MFDGKLKGKKKGDMHDLHKNAKLDVLKELSDQAGEAMSVKIMAKPSDMPEAIDIAKDKVEDVIKDQFSTDEMKEYDKNDLEDSEYDLEDEESEEESHYADNIDMGEEQEGDVEDFSKVSPDELDAQIERLTRIREKMKIASMD